MLWGIFLERQRSSPWASVPGHVLPGALLLSSKRSLLRSVFGPVGGFGRMCSYGCSGEAICLINNQWNILNWKILFNFQIIHTHNIHTHNILMVLPNFYVMIMGYYSSLITYFRSVFIYMGKYKAVYCLKFINTVVMSDKYYQLVVCMESVLR